MKNIVYLFGVILLIASCTKQIDTVSSNDFFMNCSSEQLREFANLPISRQAEWLNDNGVGLSSPAFEVVADSMYGINSAGSSGLLSGRSRRGQCGSNEVGEDMRAIWNLEDKAWTEVNIPILRELALKNFLKDLKREGLIFGVGDAACPYMDCSMISLAGSALPRYYISGTKAVHTKDWGLPLIVVTKYEGTIIREHVDCLNKSELMPYTLSKSAAYGFRPYFVGFDPTMIPPGAYRIRFENYGNPIGDQDARLIIEHARCDGAI